MILKLSTVGALYTKEDAEKLEEFGFKFDNNAFDKRKCKHKITEEVLIDISTMEELMYFVDKWGDVIVSKGKITIYDDYNE